MEPTRRARWLAGFTVAYNVVEATVAVAAGWLAGSPALLAFGLDAAIESASGLVMVWRFAVHDETTGDALEAVESRAARYVGVAFFLLAGYVVLDAGGRLLQGRAPSPSLLGIGLAVASIVVMPALFWLKERTGRELGSASLRADARQTLACLFLSVSLLVGLAANAWTGFWPADPLAGLAIAGYAVKEGIEAVRSS